jgi:hypothetical protein
MNLLKFISACLAVSAAAMVLPAQAQSISGQGTWETTLKGRDINLNAVAATDASAVYLYDTTLNVTWLRNANANGVTSWDNANDWAANLSTGSGAAAISDWRLPTMVANPHTTSSLSYDGSTDLGYNVPGISSEMASLLFDTLGNKSFFNTSGALQAGYGLTNAGSFQNMQSSGYWLGTEYAPVPNYAWVVYTSYGFQAFSTKSSQLYALAVRPGDVLAPVPEPETYAMMLAGLGVVAAIARRRKAKQTA